MGLGDVKMLAMVGAFLGARLTLLTVFLGSLLGTGIYLFARLLAWLLPGEEAPAGSDGGGITPGEGVHAAEAAPDASPASVPEQPPAQTIVRGRGSSSPLRALRRGLEAAGFLVEGRGAGMLDQIPFGSLLAVAAAIALLGGERLLAGYSAFSLSFGEWVFRLFSGGA
jgi:hypothetical protein